MKTNASKVIWLMLFVGFFAMSSISAQTARVLTDVAESSIPIKGERYTTAKRYRTLHLDKQSMQQFLMSAPEKGLNAGRNSNTIFNMPMPDGSSTRFAIYETSVMEPELAAKFPEIKTYAGQGIDDPTATVWLDQTPLGFHAMVLSPKGTVFIDPYSKGSTEDYICYFKKDQIKKGTWNCETAGSYNTDNFKSIIPKELYAQKSSGTQLRTYKLALACTGEYAAFQGGTVPLAMAAMVTTMNRVNGVYETEVAIRMNMVANNNLLIYLNAATDPYTNNNGSTMLSQNNTNCNTVIGAANYNIGHVFSTGGGGIAGLGVVCGGNKGFGVTGSGAPVGDGFDIDYVAHEIGHQFGGNHTFNSVLGACGGGNRNASTAYESGSGITIMAYAGICSTDDLAPNSIAYFHTASFDEIVNFSTTGGGNACAATTPTGNAIPVFTNTGTPKSIPISTPFVLTGSATDANGDALTYSWEEYDLGPSGAWNVQSTSAPMFRPFAPTTSGSRTFPKISDIINNTTTVGELLPNQARTLKFRLTVRDNRAGGGGVIHPDTPLNITVVNSGGAFAVTAPNTAVNWTGGTTQTITWNVSGTTGSGINTANVKISLSTDGGNTYPITLLSTTPNDGSENITVPNIATTLARVKVEAIGNIFFDISNVNFTITPVSFTSITTSAVSPLVFCAGAPLNVSFTTNGAASAGNVFRAQLSNDTGSFASPTVIGTLSSTTAGTISCAIPLNTPAGNGYRIRVVSTTPIVTGSNNGANITINAKPTVGVLPSASITVCFGNSVILSGTGAVSYFWNGGITNGVAFAPASSNTYTVLGLDANGCADTASATVTVNPLPVVAPIAGGPSVCLTNTKQLTDATPGGTWSSSDITKVTVTSTALIKGIAAGSAVISYTITNNLGCTNSSSVTITVITTLPTVAAITGNRNICIGSTSQLANATIGGSWSSSNTLIAPISNTGLVTGNAVGSAVISYTTAPNTSGCTRTATASVAVKALPLIKPITGSPYVCVGGNTQLSDLTLGGTWSSSNTSVATVGSTGLVTGVTAGTVTITYTTAASVYGCVNSTSIVVSVNPPSGISRIAAAGNPICANATTTLTAIGVTGVNPVVTWYTGPGGTGTNLGTGLTLTNRAPGLYYARVTNGCGTTPAETFIVVLSKPTSSSDTTATTCGAFTWKGVTYTTSGNYTYKTINSVGCDSVVTLHLTIQTISLTSTKVNVGCYGKLTGSITVTPTSGVPPYRYKNGATGAYVTTNTFSGLRAGTYTIYVIDTLGCTGKTTVSITQPLAAISASATKIDETCPGMMDGSITVTAAGGTPPYSYRLGSAGVYGPANTFTGLKAGSYRVYINDANNCIGYSIAVTIVDIAPTCFMQPGIAKADNPFIKSSNALEATLSPNPASGQFTLQVNASKKDIISIRILDVNGKSVYTTKGLPGQTFKFGESYMKGVYLVEVRQGNEIKTLKAVKN